MEDGNGSSLDTQLSQKNLLQFLHRFYQERRKPQLFNQNQNLAAAAILNLTLYQLQTSNIPFDLKPKAKNGVTLLTWKCLISVKNNKILSFNIFNI